MGDLVCARIFVSKPLGIEFFPLTTKPWQVFPCKIFFTLEISLQDIFSEITHTPPPLKSQMVGPLAGNFSKLLRQRERNRDNS